MTHKNGEWFRGKPEQTGRYYWGGDGVLPSETYPGHWPFHVLGNPNCKIGGYRFGWWVRVGDLDPIPPVPVPRPEAVDTPVLVRDFNEGWKQRYLAGWTECGKIKTWRDGCTSWSVKHQRTTAWNQWKLPEET